ncbi:glycosyltransferase family 2 protein [Microcoleus sp. FACHB-1515]|uniref:glycosyltransferase family 2 protein n=1 Tax=Cyanophyceae TaxID=3028117 RepID=UPI0016859EAD|nr:glycosyltransferase family A protein [Microcoleus sp. FACHB-1515]MBD2089466.1 glycosyltransferase family 2 protein [Microcoleus sp. FACHB-1515]
MPRDTPLVSVIIPAYNAAAFIDRTLRSVLSQTYGNLEVLVVDDGSTDQTSAIVTAFAREDKRVRLLQQANAGVAAARNLAIAQANGEFIAPIDADDIWYPDNLERQVECLVQSGDAVGLVYSWSVDIDDSDALIGSFRAAKIEGNVYATLVCHNFLGNASATLMRRSCLAQVGGYNAGLRSQQAQGCEDWDLYLRIAEKYEFRVVPAFLIGYRKLSASMSCDFTQMARSHRFVMQAVQQQHPELPPGIFRLSRSNLYLYFAHQSHRFKQHRTTLFWLGQALQADIVTPWIRFGLYSLLLQSLGGLLRSAIFPSDRLGQHHTIDAAKTLTEIEQQKRSIALMLLVGDLFHQVIARFTNQPLQLAADSSGSDS